MLFLNYVPNLSPLEFDIYHFIVKHLDQVVYMRIRELAKATHTSTASIQRFCHKFDCQGFTEFKIKLGMYQKELNETIEPDDNNEPLKHFLHRFNEDFLQNKVNEAAEILSKKQLIIFIGSGSSEAIGYYGTLLFANYSISALRIEDPSNYPVDSFSDSLIHQIGIIVLSVSGETQELIYSLQNSKLGQSTIISITDSEKSTIAKLSHLNIPYQIGRKTLRKTYTDNEKRVEVTSQLPAVFLIEQIAKKIFYIKNKS